MRATVPDVEILFSMAATIELRSVPALDVNKLINNYNTESICGVCDKRTHIPLKTHNFPASARKKTDSLFFVLLDVIKII